MRFIKSAHVIQNISKALLKHWHELKSFICSREQLLCCVWFVLSSLAWTVNDASKAGLRWALFSLAVSDDRSGCHEAIVIRTFFRLIYTRARAHTRVRHNQQHRSRRGFANISFHGKNRLFSCLLMCFLCVSVRLPPTSGFSISERCWKNIKTRRSDRPAERRRGSVGADFIRASASLCLISPPSFLQHVQLPIISSQKKAEGQRRGGSLHLWQTDGALKPQFHSCLYKKSLLLS